MLNYNKSNFSRQQIYALIGAQLGPWDVQGYIQASNNARKLGKQTNVCLAVNQT